MSDPKKIIVCKDRNHLAAFKNDTTDMIELQDECLYEEYNTFGRGDVWEEVDYEADYDNVGQV